MLGCFYGLSTMSEAEPCDKQFRFDGWTMDMEYIGIERNKKNMIIMYYIDRGLHRSRMINLVKNVFFLFFFF